MKKIYLLLVICLSCQNANTDQTNLSITKTKSESLVAEPIWVEDIAGKTPSEVEEILGTPTSRETVNPSNTPCPCDKLTYKDGEFEIVYINGVSDWITINNPSAIFFQDETIFESVNRFDDYAYIKTKTP